MLFALGKGSFNTAKQLSNISSPAVTKNPLYLYNNNNNIDLYIEVYDIALILSWTDMSVEVFEGRRLQRPPPRTPPP